MKSEKKVLPITDYNNLYIENNDLEEIVYKNQKSNYIRKVINKLKPDYQAVICLASIEGFKYKEIAKIMGKNVGQVKVMLNRAKKKLKEKLEEEGLQYEV